MIFFLTFQENYIFPENAIKKFLNADFEISLQAINIFEQQKQVFLSAARVINYCDSISMDICFNPQNSLYI